MVLQNLRIIYWINYQRFTNKACKICTFISNGWLCVYALYIFSVTLVVLFFDSIWLSSLSLFWHLERPPCRPSCLYIANYWSNERGKLPKCRKTRYKMSLVYIFQMFFNHAIPSISFFLLVYCIFLYGITTVIVLIIN